MRRVRHFASSAARANGMVSRSYAIPTLSIPPDKTREKIQADLAQKMAMAPLFFQSAPVVLDFCGAKVSASNVKEFVDGFSSLGLLPVGVCGVASDIKTALADSGMPVLTSQASKSVEPSPSPNKRSPTLVVPHVRSGQQVYASGGDLVVMGGVGSGAEVLADGDIHIYGSLKGRALAGLSGDTGSTIFALDFQAELVCVSDAYELCEEIPQGVIPRKPTYARLVDGVIEYECVKTL